MVASYETGEALRRSEPAVRLESARSRGRSPEFGQSDVFCLAKKVGLCLLFLFQQEVEMIVEASRSRLCTGGQLLLPLFSLTNPVDVDAGYENASRSRASDTVRTPEPISRQPWTKRGRS